MHHAACSCILPLLRGVVLDVFITSRQETGESAFTSYGRNHMQMCDINDTINLIFPIRNFNNCLIQASAHFPYSVDF
jgi:hypothetical protein